MAAVVNVDLIEDDNENPIFQITSGDDPLSLTGVTITAVIKSSEHVADNDAGAYPLSVGSGITVVDAAAGKIKLTVPSAVNSSPSNWFYKIMVTASSESHTALYGWMAVLDV